MWGDDPHWKFFSLAFSSKVCQLLYCVLARDFSILLSSLNNRNHSRGKFIQFNAYFCTTRKNKGIWEEENIFAHDKLCKKKKREKFIEWNVFVIIIWVFYTTQHKKAAMMMMKMVVVNAPCGAFLLMNSKEVFLSLF